MAANAADKFTDKFSAGGLRATDNQVSGSPEIAGGVLGAVAVLHMTVLLPYALSFAAGAMIYVVVEELIPESQRCQHNDLATMGTIAGFALMMFLDVALG